MAKRRILEETVEVTRGGTPVKTSRKRGKPRQVKPIKLPNTPAVQGDLKEFGREVAIYNLAWMRGAENERMKRRK